MLMLHKRLVAHPYRRRIEARVSRQDPEIYANQARSRRKSTNRVNLIPVPHSFLSLRTPLLKLHLHYMVEVGVGLLWVLQLSAMSVHRMMPQVGPVHIILMQAVPMGKVVSEGVGYQEGPDKVRRT
jgi:hypothetical protein